MIVNYPVPQAAARHNAWPIWLSLCMHRQRRTPHLFRHSDSGPAPLTALSSPSLLRWPHQCLLAGPASQAHTWLVVDPRAAPCQQISDDADSTWQRCGNAAACVAWLCHAAAAATPPYDVAHLQSYTGHMFH
jgi:hypothetical protein